MFHSMAHLVIHRKLYDTQILNIRQLHLSAHIIHVV